MRVFLHSARKLLFAFLKHSKPSLYGQAALLCLIETEEAWFALCLRSRMTCAC